MLITRCICFGICLSSKWFHLKLTFFFSMKNLAANAGDIRDVGSVPNLGRSPRGGHGNPLQNSCLENPMDRGAWRATVHGVAKSQTRLKWLSTHRLYLGMPRKFHFLTSHVNNCPFTMIFWENFPYIFCLLWDMPYAWIEEQGVWMPLLKCFFFKRTR